MPASTSRSNKRSAADRWPDFFEDAAMGSVRHVRPSGVVVQPTIENSGWWLGPSCHGNDGTTKASFVAVGSLPFSGEFFSSFPPPHPSFDIFAQKPFQISSISSLA
jgi:hypothetical protein